MTATINSGKLTMGNTTGDRSDVTTIRLTIGVLALLLASGAYGLDLPIKLDFQLGFAIRVVPSSTDLSHKLGLVVAANRPITDKTRSMVVTGTITNFSGVPRDNIAMQVAVSSYVGTGVSLGVATVEPTCLPPGGAATFSAHITLGSEKPRNVMYTVTAATPPGVVLPVAEPAASAPPR